MKRNKHTLWCKIRRLFLFKRRVVFRTKRCCSKYFRIMEFTDRVDFTRLKEILDNEELIT